MARPTVLHCLFAALGVIIGAAQGCSKQGEGERCEPLAARDDDCEEGLVCVTAKELGETFSEDVDFGRCCPQDLSSASDSRCRPGGSIPTFDGGTDASMNGGAPGTAGAPAGGEPGNGGVPGNGGTPGTSGAGGTPDSSGGQSGAAGAVSSPTAGAGGV